MFVTSVAYDYFKGFVTAFIEINGQPETIFGKPPVKYVVPLVNLVSALEGFCFALFTTFIIIHLENGDSLFAVFAPMYLYFGFMLIGMVVLYIYFMYCSFRYAKSAMWIGCFVIGLPLGFINVLLFFGSPLLASIMFPIQKGTDLWQAATTWDTTLYVMMGLAGGLIRGFVRPSEDEENPYSTHTPGVLLTLCYFFFFFMIVVFLFLLTCQVDGSLPSFLGGANFKTDWWVVWTPLIIGQILGLIVFSVKAFKHWRLVYKHEDPNGDGLYRGIVFVGLISFLILALIAQFLTIIRLNNPEFGLNAGLCLIPLPLGFLIIVVISLIPFVTFFQRNVNKADTRSREMMTAL